MSVAFTTAAVCRLGHTVSRDISEDAAPARCPRCGVQVFSHCLRCKEPVRGPEYELRQGPTPMSLVRIWGSGGYQPAPQCHGCGDRYPWAVKGGQHAPTRRRA